MYYSHIYRHFEETGRYSSGQCHVAGPVDKFRERKDGKPSSQHRRNENVTSGGYIGIEKWGKITAFKSRVPLSTSKGGSTRVTLTRIVTPYRDSVDGTRDRVTYQKLVTR